MYLPPKSQAPAEMDDGRLKTPRAPGGMDEGCGNVGMRRGGWRWTKGAGNVGMRCGGWDGRKGRGIINTPGGRGGMAMAAQDAAAPRRSRPRTYAPASKSRTMVRRKACSSFAGGIK